MPTVEKWITPELFRSIKGHDVFHVYKDNDFDQGVLRYSFTLNPDSDDESFDVRYLETSAVQELEKHPPFLTDDNPVWASASSDEREQIERDWDVWFETGLNEAIVKVIAEALDSGLLQKPSADVEVERER